MKKQYIIPKTTSESFHTGFICQAASPATAPGMTVGGGTLGGGTEVPGGSSIDPM